uniref:de novo designed protein n=1 Tax=synthetic construct TaxID=32630 RepID=UPI00267420C5|nr:Chain A, de novo designed protein [synthetic construct]
MWGKVVVIGSGEYGKRAAQRVADLLDPRIDVYLIFDAKSTDEIRKMIKDHGADAVIVIGAPLGTAFAIAKAAAELGAAVIVIIPRRPGVREAARRFGEEARKYGGRVEVLLGATVEEAVAFARRVVQQFFALEHHHHHH